MTTGIIHDQTIEKQMGCMAGFLHLFDRHQILTGKRIYAAKRLSHAPSPKVGSAPDQERTVGSPAYSAASEKEAPARVPSSPDRADHSPSSDLRSPAKNAVITLAEAPARSPVPLPVFECKEGSKSSWKFKEAPRLSLDSRATVDARGSLRPKKIRTNAAILHDNRREDDEVTSTDEGEKQRRSTSVIARLMGLEPLLGAQSSPQPATRNPELRRSASESRVSRDLFQFRLSVDGNSGQMKQPQQSNPGINVMMMRDSNAGFQDRARDLMERRSSRIAKSEPPHAAVNRGFTGPPRKPPQQRKSYFDSADFFPGPKHTMSVYGEIDRRLKMRGIDEPSQDLETLKQILEGLQLKGLLHSRRNPNDQIHNRNIVYPGNFSPHESSIIVMKPSRSRKVINESQPSRVRSGPDARRKPSFSGEFPPPPSSPRRYQPRSRNSNSPTRSEGSTKSAASSPRRKPLQVETRRKLNETTEPRRRISSPAHSPKLSPRGLGTNPTVSTSRSPRYRKPTAEIYSKEDESSSVSAESSLSTSSHTETERLKGEGRNGVLERCDKLLHSIAEMNAAAAAAAGLQPSPVSVLDAAFFNKEEESSPSPVPKRSIDFTDLGAEFEDESWPAAISPDLSEENAGDGDFFYMSEVLRASSCCLPEEDSDIFLLLEKQLYYRKGRDASGESRLRRRLIFDTVAEILDRKERLPPWKAVVRADASSAPKQLRQIWLEFRRIRDAESPSGDICGVLRKDLAGDAESGWGDCPQETSELVLDIERQLFKDLIGDAIQSLASSAGKFRESVVPRRKLAF